MTERDLEAIGRRAATALEEEAERVVRPSTEERLAAIHRRREAPPSSSRARRSRRLFAAVAFAAALAATLLLFLRAGSVRPLTYHVGGEPAQLGQWVGADGADTRLDFSDGSRIDVRAAARARVTELGPDGAAVLVERGSLHVSVVHRENTRWVVASGPFEVHVIGTEFEVSWNPATEALSIAMVSGTVRVEGPCIERSTRVVSAPERLELSCSSAPAQKPTAAATQPSAAAPPPATAAASAEQPPGPGPAPNPSPSWRALLASGQAREAFNAAESGGIDEALEQASGGELIELGSGARLAGKGARATRFYEAARARFPKTDAAAMAAYHLGRMAFDGRSAWAEAEKWFGAYLAERPGGALAPEALGRSMECASKRGDTAQTEALAIRYLVAYPDGPHAALARKLLGKDADQ